MRARSFLAVLVLAGLFALGWLAFRPAREGTVAETGTASVDGPAPPPSKLAGSERLGIAPELASSMARIDAKLDGWDTEELSSKALGALKKVGKALAHAGRHCEAEARAIVAAEYRGTRLRPPALREVPTGGVARVRAWDVSVFVERPHGETFPFDDPRMEVDQHGVEAFLASLRGWTAAFPDDAELAVEFKSIRVGIDGDGFGMLARAQLSGVGREGRTQLTAFWHTRWSFAGGNPTLLEVDVQRHEEAIGPEAPLFSDSTDWVLSNAPEARQQLAESADVVSATLDRMHGVSFVGHEGLAVGDADGDGLDDVYVCQGGGQPNRLLLQGPDGRVRDASAEAGVDVLDPTRSALFVDFDGDGDQDLVLGGEGVTIFENDGRAHFTQRARFATSVVTSMAAADVDRDGDLDLYVCRYDSTENTAPTPYHDAENGVPNVLLRNDGAFAFADATVESGLDANNRRFSFACAFGDYDDDGDPDLAVANDFGRKNLYRNDGGHFVDVAAELGVEDAGAGMSAAWGDYDRDGRLDLWFANMFSSAGNRVAFQPRFQSAASAADQAALRRHARGNTLLRNAGARFDDASEAAGVTLARWAWSSIFADVDDDGLEDLLVANGYLSNQDPDDL
ncbi:MAG: VCBS repeat-containing protein [Planctomycetes bacterium]|nr:VCBS repeat-containing protein [Planctomycetota bacterium]